MPPAVGRYNLGNIQQNPFAHLNQPHHAHQTSHLQHHNANLNSINNVGQPSFAHSQNIFQSTYNNNNNHALNSSRMIQNNPAAQIGFQHGALQQQQEAQGGAVGGAGTKSMGGGRIRDVWKSNLAQEMQMLRNLLDEYPYISMDTEFPGIVARPIGNFSTKADYHYQTLRCNVDLLKLIQLGITLFSIEGELPPERANTSTTLNRQSYTNNLIMCPCTWSFNFQFSLDDDMCAEESIKVLQKAGVNFANHAEKGIDPQEFGSLLISSGMVLDDSIHWLSFHSAYDFAYLLKVMMCKPLPNDEAEFRQLVKLFFPNLYDLKFLLKHTQRLALSRNPNLLNGAGQNSGSNANPQPTTTAPLPPGQGNATAAVALIQALGTKSGLQDLADALDVPRNGIPHTAGSDCWLTGSVFWAMRAKIFDNKDIPEELRGQIWGINAVGAPAGSAAAAVQQPFSNSQQGQQTQQGQGQAQQAAMSTPNTNGATLYAGEFHSGATPGKSDASPRTPQGQMQGQMGMATQTQIHMSGPGHPGGGGGGAGFGNFSYGA